MFKLKITIFLCLLLIGSVSLYYRPLYCYKCWTTDVPVKTSKNVSVITSRHVPEDQAAWSNCKKHVQVVACFDQLSQRLMAECLSIVNDKEKFQIKGCLTPELYKYKLMCRKNNDKTGIHCNTCKEHLCNKADERYFTVSSQFLILSITPFLIYFTLKY